MPDSRALRAPPPRHVSEDADDARDRPPEYAAARTSRQARRGRPRRARRREVRARHGLPVIARSIRLRHALILEVRGDPQRSPPDHVGGRVPVKRSRARFQTVDAQVAVVPDHAVGSAGQHLRRRSASRGRRGRLELRRHAASRPARVPDGARERAVAGRPPPAATAAGGPWRRAPRRASCGSKSGMPAKNRMLSRRQPIVTETRILRDVGENEEVRRCRRLRAQRNRPRRLGDADAAARLEPVSARPDQRDRGERRAGQAHGERCRVFEQVFERALEEIIGGEKPPRARGAPSAGDGILRFREARCRASRNCSAEKAGTLGDGTKVPGGGAG